MKLSSAVRALVVILTFSLLITLSVYKYLESAPSTYLSIRPAQELSNVSHPASNSTQLINPLLSKRCRNAIFDHDRKEMNSEIINFQNGHCPEFTGFYSREAMDALSIKQCPSTHGPVRSHQLLLQWIQLTDEKKASLSEREREEAYKEWFKSFPIYYMIPKGGSSSIFSLLKLTNKYGEFGQIFHENLRYQAPKWNDCSFTFVRNPIDRLLSGYYTLNVKIWRSLDGGFEHWSNETLANRLHRIWNFIKIKGEPLRFQTFVNELVSEPNNFTNSPHHDHVMSISHLLSRHLGYSDPQLNGNLHFVGKVENFTNDMASLMKKCDYFDENDLNLLLEDKRASHQMKSWGWGSPSSWENEWEKYKNWVKWMGLMPLFKYYNAEKAKNGRVDMENIKPPAYFAIDRDTYDKIIDYYIQDLICFGYEQEAQYETFEQKRNEFHNIYKNSSFN